MLTSVTCPCGCKETFMQRREGQKFKDKKHKDDYHNTKRGTVLQALRGLPDEQYEDVVKYIEKRKRALDA